MMEFDPKNVKAHPKVLEFYRQMKQVLAVPQALKYKGCCRRSRIACLWTRMHVRTLACKAYHVIMISTISIACQRAHMHAGRKETRKPVRPCAPVAELAMCAAPTSHMRCLLLTAN